MGDTTRSRNGRWGVKLTSENIAEAIEKMNASQRDVEIYYTIQWTFNGVQETYSVKYDDRQHTWNNSSTIERVIGLIRLYCEMSLCDFGGVMEGLDGNRVALFSSVGGSVEAQYVYVRVSKR